MKVNDTNVCIKFRRTPNKKMFGYDPLKGSNILNVTFEEPYEDHYDQECMDHILPDIVYVALIGNSIAYQNYYDNTNNIKDDIKHLLNKL